MKSIDKLKRLTGEDIKKPPRGHSEDKAGLLQTSSSEKQKQIDDLRRRIESVVRRTQTRNTSIQAETATRGNLELMEILKGREMENEHGRFSGQ